MIRYAFPLLSCILGFARGAEFPEPYNSEKDKSAEPPPAEEALKQFTLPAGFQATLFASEPEVRNPIAMAWDHRGRMWVAENYTYAESGKRFDLDLRDRVLVFEDDDSDGRADSRKVFAEDLQMLTSIEVGHDGIWALCPPQLLFIPDRNGDDIPDGPPEVKLDGFTVSQGNYHNFANGLRWGPDGWLYGRCGHSCPGRLGTPGTPDSERVPIRGGIWRFHPERGIVEVLTHGTVNPWGHDWDAHGELFFINTVIGHLWHGIPGAHFKESGGNDPNPDVFERLDMHADHWHFDTTGNWTASRDGKANDFGGGHAHIGMMIYQSEQWPEELHGRLFTLNLHGHRTNMERLEREGSGYVGKHQDDVFLMGDPWFRGIDIQQGPDGSAYVLDWSDTSECHDHSGVHRTSGRIYRISYGMPAQPDLADLLNPTPDAVRRLVMQPNVWFERQFRQRADASAIPVLKEILANDADSVIRLRALWTLHALGGTTPELLRKLLDEKDEHLRVWAIRLLTDGQPIDSILGPRAGSMPPPLGAGQFERILTMARSDDSGLVRLALASTLQRLPLDQRGELGAALAARNEDAHDHNLPAMVWYGLIPLADADPLALVRVAETCRWPDTLRWMSRSLASRVERNAAPLDALLALAAKSDSVFQSVVLQGISEAFKGRRTAPRPVNWDTLIDALSVNSDPSIVANLRQLTTLFGDDKDLDAIRKAALDKKADPATRKSALETLIGKRPSDLREICESLLGTKGLAATAVRGLSLFDDPTLGDRLSERYLRFPPADRPAVIEALVSRPTWAAALLTQMKAGRIPRTDLAAFHARQIRAFDSKPLNAILAEVWGELRETSADKRRLVDEWKTKLTPDEIGAGDLRKGRALFQGVCGACHVMYGNGGRIGPDLTGSGRKDLGYLLENIADPSAVVGADYRMTILTLRDGRVVTGVTGEENEQILTLRQIAGELTVEKTEIAKRETTPFSMMPEGMLSTLPPEQIRNLIAYLQYPTQVPLPETKAERP
jgi:putative membrane-bound dehydrogenase-like protein